jgi:hypothetical protein
MLSPLGFGVGPLSMSVKKKEKGNGKQQWTQLEILDLPSHAPFLQRKGLLAKANSLLCYVTLAAKKRDEHILHKDSQKNTRHPSTNANRLMGYTVCLQRVLLLFQT